MVFLIVWLALVIPTPVVFSDTEVPELELDAIVAGVKYNDSLLKTGKGDFIVRQVMSEEAKRLFPTGREDDIQLKVAFDGVKVRCETVTDKSLDIFDGEKQVEIDLSKKNAEAKISVGIKGRRRMDQRYDPRHWGLYMTEEPLGGGQPLGEYLEEKAIQVVGHEHINGILCYVVKAKRRRRGTIKFWIAPEQGFRVLKSQQETAAIIPTPPFKRLPVVDIMETVYQEVKDGIWFPKSAVNSSFLLNKKTGKQNLLIRDFLTVKKIEVNGDVSDQFQFNISPDTIVWDHRSGSKRTAAEAGISTNKR
jgi:hypothetical protein